VLKIWHYAGNGAYFVLRKGKEMCEAHPGGSQYVCSRTKKHITFGLRYAGLVCSCISPYRETVYHPEPSV